MSCSICWVYTHRCSWSCVYTVCVSYRCDTVVMYRCHTELMSYRCDAELMSYRCDTVVMLYRCQAVEWWDECTVCFTELCLHSVYRDVYTSLYTQDALVLFGWRLYSSTWNPIKHLLE